MGKAAILINAIVRSIPIVSVAAFILSVIGQCTVSKNANFSYHGMDLQNREHHVEFIHSLTGWTIVVNLLALIIAFLSTGRTRKYLFGEDSSIPKFGRILLGSVLPGLMGIFVTVVLCYQLYQFRDVGRITEEIHHLTDLCRENTADLFQQQKTLSMQMGDPFLDAVTNVKFLEFCIGKGIVDNQALALTTFAALSTLMEMLMLMMLVLNMHIVSQQARFDKAESWENQQLISGLHRPGAKGKDIHTK